MDGVSIKFRNPERDLETKSLGKKTIKSQSTNIEIYFEVRRAGEPLPTGVGAHTGTVTSSQAPDHLVLSEGPGRVSGRQDGGRTRFDTDVPSANTAAAEESGR